MFDFEAHEKFTQTLERDYNASQTHSWIAGT